MEEVARTETDSVQAQRFAQDAVELPHLAQRGGRPAVSRDGRLDLFPERRDELRGLLREVVESVSDGLESPCQCIPSCECHQGSGVRKGARDGLQCSVLSAHHRRGVDGREVHEQQSLDDSERGFIPCCSHI